jgi:hypothetical protein
LEQGRAVKEGVRMLEEGVHEVKLGNGGVLKVSDFLLFYPSASSFALVLFQGSFALQQGRVTESAWQKGIGSIY